MIENVLIQARLNQLFVTIWDKCDIDSRMGEDGRTKGISIESLSLSWTDDWTREISKQTKELKIITTIKNTLSF